MKTEQVSRVFGIVLKAVAIICIVIVTYSLWLGKDNGKYKVEKQAAGFYIYNTQKGIITGIGSEDNQMLRMTIEPFKEDLKNILKKTTVTLDQNP